MKIVVVGSIAAGISAADKISAGRPDAKVTVYDRGRFYSCGSFGLPFYLNQSLEELGNALEYKNNEIKKRGISAFLRHEVTEVNPAAHKLVIKDMENNRTFEDTYDKLVLATGCTVKVPAVPGCDRMGVQRLKNVEDLIFLKEFTRTPYVSDIVVLGGGIAGIEMAKAFVKMGRKVRIIERERTLLADFDPEVSESIKKELEAQGVAVTLGETVTAFPGRTYVEKVKTNRGSYDCDLCICTDTYKAECGLACTIGARADSSGRILVNDDLESSVKDIYAVGGCACYEEEHLKTVSLRTYDFEIARTGLTETEAKKKGLRAASVTGTGLDRPGIVPNPNCVTLKLVYDSAGGKLLGAQGWGRKNVSVRINTLAVAIAAGMTAAELSKVDLVFSSGTFSIWDPVQITCNLVSERESGWQRRYSR